MRRKYLSNYKIKYLFSLDHLIIISQLSFKTLLDKKELRNQLGLVRPTTKTKFILKIYFLSLNVFATQIDLRTKNFIFLSSKK